MRYLSILLIALVALPLTGCASFWADMNRAYDKGHPPGTKTVIQPLAPMPTYTYPTYQAPPVYQPTVQRAGGQYICNTIGYVTSCQKQ